MAHFLASDQASFINCAGDPQGRGGVSSSTGSYFRMSPHGNHADDSTSSNGKEEDKHLRRIEENGYDGSQGRQTASSQSNKADEFPGNRLTSYWTGDTKSFNHVVQPEANDQDKSELETPAAAA
jgi:hypothetical protein